MFTFNINGIPNIPVQRVIKDITKEVIIEKPKWKIYLENIQKERNSTETKLLTAGTSIDISESV